MWTSKILRQTHIPLDLTSKKYKNYMMKIIDKNHDLNNISLRIKEANASLKGHDTEIQSKTKKKDSALAIAFRVGVELISALTVGTAIGWWLDKWLNSSPWMLILFILLGFLAGIWNTYKVAKGLELRKNEKKNLL